ncbi:MAG: ROK family protein [bacterium]
MAGRRVIGIDIGGTKCAIILGDEGANILDRTEFPTETQRGADRTLSNIIKAIGEIVDRNGLSFRDVRSFGISCGGPLDSRRGVVMSPPNLPGWDNIPIVDILRERFGVPAFLQNDANACALAEWKFGAGRGYRNLVFLTFGTGMGAGLILDGHLYSGTNDLAGEVGHIRLAEDGPVGYGKAGSFEGFCSGGGIANLAKSEVRRRLEMGEAVSFCPNVDMVESITTRDVGLAAARGDPVAVEILKISGRYLGYGLSILIDVLNPEIIIIGSIFVRCREFLQPEAERVIRQEALEPARKVCRIVPAGLGERIGDYASLSVALEFGR